MRENACPSCGARFNGRRCRHCGYEHFSEEIAHGGHWHKGEPLVVRTPRRGPIARKDPFGCEKKTRKPRPFLGFLGLLLAINSLLPLIRNFGLELEAREEALVQPEYFPIPEDAPVLYQGEEVTVLAQWPQPQGFFRDFPVYVRNDSRRDVTVTARELLVNGYVMESSSLWCEAAAGTPGLGMFFLSEQDMVNAGIQAIETISFRLDIYDNESYETIALSPVVTLTADLPEGTQGIREPEGEVVFDREGLRISYLGFSYAVSAYDPYAFEDGALLFHLDNQTGRDLEVSFTEGCVNGIPGDLGCWCSLPEGAKAVVSAGTYPLPELGITQPEQIREVTFLLDVWESGTYETFLPGENLTIPAADMGQE